MTAQTRGVHEAGVFLQRSGLVIEEVSGTRVTGYIDLGPDHHTPWGIVNGGVYATAVALNQGRTQQLWRVDIRDQSGRLVAHGELRLQNVPVRNERPA